MFSLIPSYVFNHFQVYRLLTNHIFHVDELHLYFNMIALMFRGTQFENTYGRKTFLTTIFFLASGSSLLYVCISHISLLLEFNALFYKPVIGFSAILFGLKTIMDRQLDYQQIFGYVLPSKYVVFLELALVTLLQPQVSFLGHLCGIVAGIFVDKYFLS